MNRHLAEGLTFAVGLLAGSCSTTAGFVLGGPSGAGAVLAEGGSVDGSEESGALAVAVSGAGTTAQQGGDGGTPFADFCPEGEAVVGYQGFLADPSGLTIIGSIQTLCGSLGIDSSAGGRVTTTPGVWLPVRGLGDDGGGWVETCPADQAVVGFVGRSGLYFDQVAFECAPWWETPDAGGAFTMGAPTTLDGAGGDGGTPYQVTCPPGELARGSAGRSGLWVDAFGLLCGTPTLLTGGEGP